MARQLQPLVKELPGYLRDTKHTVTTSCDVVELYPSIPHSLAISSLSCHLNKYSAYSPNIREFILMATEFLLTHNFFTFDNMFFLQQQGASMGAKFSHLLANILMATWEELFMYNPEAPFSSYIRWYGH